MARPIITANELREARKNGRTELRVPPDALVTPQAVDDAREFGIRIVREAPAVPEAAAPRRAVHVAGSVPGRITLYAGKAFEEAMPDASAPAGAAGMRRLPRTDDAGNMRRVKDCKLGVCMIFLTEDDIRQRAVARGGALALSTAERLTPSALEYIREQRIRVVEDEAAPNAAEAASGARERSVEVSEAEPRGQGLTHLDAASMVAKTHPRIEARGKLDSLLAAAVLVQTQFDPRGKLPDMLKECLAEVKEWIFQTLAAEVSGSILPPQSMGGMPMEVLRAVSRNPRQYLHTDHLMPDASLGTNIALLNWLRALTRETELAAAKAALCRTDIQESLNRLSSAVYVLMLLTHLAESGAGIPNLP